jgi:hypothetical protein
MKLRDPEGWLPNHVDRFSRLGAALGPNLLQLPPRWRRDVGRLDAFLAAAPSAWRWAVELREASWLHDDVYETLRRHGAALVFHDLLAEIPPTVTAGFVYLRFHGPNAIEERYQGRYGGRRLWRWAERCAAWLEEGLHVYAFFNNDWQRRRRCTVAAPRSCRTGCGSRLSTLPDDGRYFWSCRGVSGELPALGLLLRGVRRQRAEVLLDPAQRRLRLLVAVLAIPAGDVPQTPLFGAPSAGVGGCRRPWVTEEE